MFYHARVKIKPERAKESAKFGVETDLSYEDLLEKIAGPFIRGEQFYCGGLVVQPTKVEEIKFNQTDQSSGDLLPLLRARARNSGIIMAVSKRDVIHEGKDITRQVLDAAKSDFEQEVLDGLMADAEQSTGRTKVAARARKQSDRVFIVHGHDNHAVDQTEILIHRFGLTPVILKEAPNAGRTVIEKFEAHAEVGVAIVLLTPDDVGGIDAAHLAPRARQNVIWEWGYLVANLGRSHVICLYKQGVEMPSDLLGLVTIHVEDDVRDKAEDIRRELVAAGYTIP